MFTTEENQFLATILKMFSNSNEERKASEKNIQSWLEVSYDQILVSCNKFIVCEQLQPNIREYSCYLITLCTSPKYYQNWQQLNSDLKASIQTNSLGLLGNQIKSIRQQACILVTAVFSISVRDQGWPNLISTLCNACTSNNIEFKISAVKTLGMIWEKLPKEPFSLDELSLMENTILTLLSKPENPILSEICLDAYQYFIFYVKDKFTNLKYIEEVLKLIIKYCGSIDNLITPEVAKMAIHRITDIILLAYDYVDIHFKNISEFFIQLAKGDNELLAVQAFIFFIEISQDEIKRKESGFSYKKYIPSIWNILWPCIQIILDIGKKGEEDEFSRYDAINYLLINLSILCDGSIIDDIFNYMSERLNNPDPLKNNSAIYAFCSIVETVHKEKIEVVIPSALQKMTNLFAKNNVDLSINLSWCFSRICNYHSAFILQNNEIFSFLINTIINLLKEPSLINKIKMHLCQSIYNLSSFIYNNNYQSLNLFSPFLQDLLLILENLSYFDNAYDTDNNLAEKSFIALSSLIECSDEKDRVLISLFMDKIFVRLVEAQDISKFNGKTEKLYFYQSMLCLAVQSLCKNTVFNLIKMDNEKIEKYFDIIESYFKMRSSVFESGLFALSGLITLIPEGDNLLDKLMQRIMQYILYSLNTYTDAENCKNALLSLLDLIHASKNKFINYIKDIYPLLNNIIKAEDADKNLLSLIIVVYSDLFNFVGKDIWNYCQEPLNLMEQILEFCRNNYKEYLNNNKIEPEDYIYFIKLNEGLVDFIEAVSDKLKNEDENKIEKFKEYMQEIFDYLSKMIENQMFNPSNDYLTSCLCFLNNFCEIYNKYLFYKINDYTLQRIFQLANDSGNDNIIHLKDYLQNLVYTIKMKQ
jgi:hypothetical protein